MLLALLLLEVVPLSDELDPPRATTDTHSPMPWSGSPVAVDVEVDDEEETAALQELTADVTAVAWFEDVVRGPGARLAQCASYA